MATSQQLAAFNYAVPGPLVWNPVKTASFTAVAGNAYPVNTTSNAVTVTLPASPSAGQIVQVTDYAGTFGTNACTIARNGSNILGFAQNTTLTYTRQSVAFVYIDATQGWMSYSVSTLNLFAAYTASYLIAAGGGGAGVSYGAGGGAGGLLIGTTTFNTGTTYTVTVGAGGTYNVTTGGSNSTAFGLTAIGGGVGGGNAGATGGSGGSGGGGKGGSGSGSGGSGTTGQGNAGSAGNGNAGGAGGGAGAAGAAPVGTVGGAGGAGLASTITGTSIYYAGGGSGNGTGGAAAPGNGGTAVMTNGAANSGAGAGGDGSYTGGSGVVIISVPTTSYTGLTTGIPTVTTSGSNTIMKFTASGSYTA